MADNFISFNFKNESLSDYNGKIINDGADLQIFSTPSFTNQFEFPKFGNKSLLTGVDKQNRTFNFNIILVDISFLRYKEFLNWLNLNDTGILSFDYNPNYGINVKLDSISPANIFPSKYCEDEQLYSAELTIQFTTVGDWAARWIGQIPSITFTVNPPSSTNIIDNNEGQDFITDIIQSNNTNKWSFHLINNHQLVNYYIVNFNIESPHSITIKINNENYYVLKGDGTLFTEFGIALKEDGDFIPIESLGVFGNEATSSWELTSSESDNFSATITITPVSREYI
jgi:hypothetical protein